MTSSPVSSTWTPAGPGPLVAVDVEEGRELGEDVVEAPRLAAALAGEGVAVHGVAGPHDGVALGLDRPHERREQLVDPVGPEAGDEGEAAREAVGVQPLAQRHDLARACSSGRSCTPIGLLMPERNSTWAPSSWRVRSPTQTMWAEQSYQSPVSESTPGEALLVGEDQRLVARPEVDLVQPLLGAEVDAAGAP